MGPWLADTIRQCDGLVDMMSFWTFSDVFEEEGVVRKPFYGGFGIIAEDNIPKPAYNAFALLHKLGDTRLHSDSKSALITRRKGGTLAIALWNYAEPIKDREAPVPAKTFELTLNGVSTAAKAYVSRVDDSHSNVLPAYDAMGQPDWPTQVQIARLQAAARMGPPEKMNLKDDRLVIEVPAHGLVLLEIR
jgi:xylan 1,4-beta-xylosidase